MAGWSRVFGSNMFNELRGSFNTVRSDVIHPAFGIDANPQYGIKGVPNDPRFYGGLPHIADRARAAHRRTVLPPAVPGLAGVPARQQPDVAEGQPRDEVRRRVPPRQPELHRPALAQRRAQLHRTAATRASASAISCSAWRARSG